MKTSTKLAIAVCVVTASVTAYYLGQSHNELAYNGPAYDEQKCQYAKNAVAYSKENYKPSWTKFCDTQKKVYTSMPDIMETCMEENYYIKHRELQDEATQHCTPKANNPISVKVKIRF